MTRYFAMVGVGTELLLWLCEGLERSVRTFSQSRLQELGRGNLVRLLKLPADSVIVVIGDAFQVGSAYSDGHMEGMSAVDAVRSHIHFVKMSYSLSDAFFCLPKIKPRSLNTTSASTERRLQPVVNET